MSIGENIKKKRKSLDLSQEYVATQLKVSRQAVSKWETGQSEPSTRNLLRLAEVFSCDVKEILSAEKSVKMEETVNRKQDIFLSVLGIIICFGLFVVGMLYAEEMPLLVAVGITGFVGMSLLVSRIVTEFMENLS